MQITLFPFPADEEEEEEAEREEMPCNYDEAVYEEENGEAEEYENDVDDEAVVESYHPSVTYHDTFHPCRKIKTNTRGRGGCIRM